MLAAFMPCIHAAQITDSGACGENLNWTLDSDGALTISGEGDMENYEQTGNTPWLDKRETITSIVIEDGVTRIGDYTFCYCTNLTSVTLPDGITGIGNYVFYGCSSLTDISLPDSITSIGKSAFERCWHLTEINVSAGNGSYCSVDGVLFNADKTEIIKYPEGKSNTDYQIPDSVTSIGDSSFYDCDNLTDVTIPDSVTSIGTSAFGNCSKLKSIVIPKNVKSINDDTFSCCTSLTSLTISDGVTSIGQTAFSSCSALTSVVIPDSVTSIGSYAFGYCYALKNLTLGNGITRVGSCSFTYCTGLKSVTIPDSVTSIDLAAFSYCSGLKSVIIGKNVTNIDVRAFCDCGGLERVVIPKSVTTIEKGVFEECPNLTNVEYCGSETEWAEISVGADNDFMKTAATNYNSTGVLPPVIGEAVVSGGQDGVYTVTVPIEDNPYSCKVICALYSGNTMSGFNFETVTPADNSAEINIKSGAADTARIFFWDSLSGMKPLRESKPVTLKSN